MSLNMIDLPAFVIAELYADALVAPMGSPRIKNEPVVPVSTAAVPSNKNKSLGDNLKHILVVLNYPGLEQFPDKDLDLLKGILAACKLSLADVAIVNLDHYAPHAYKQLTALFKSRIVLLFNVSPVDFGLPMNFPFYQIQPFAGNSFLYAPSLADLEKDKIEKSRLWVSLKRLFNL